RGGAKLAVVTERPTALDGGATEVTRYAPGGLGELLDALGRGVERRRGAKAREEALGPASVIRDAERVVVVYGERAAASGLLALADALELAGRDGCGLLEVPDEANARGLREVGCVSNAGPGLGETASGKDSAAIRESLASGELSSVLLLNSDPVR